VANNQPHAVFGTFVPFIEQESVFMTDQVRFAFNLFIGLSDVGDIGSVNRLLKFMFVVFACPLFV